MQPPRCVVTAAGCVCGCVCPMPQRRRSTKRPHKWTMPLKRWPLLQDVMLVRLLLCGKAAPLQRVPPDGS